MSAAKNTINLISLYSWDRFNSLSYKKKLLSNQRIVLLSLFVSLVTCIGSSQEFSSIKNFYPLDYNGENQNWSISQSSEKIIYVANSKGLLEFNGAYWKQYLSPNESIMRSVKVVDDLIYTGCYMEFGYWKKNASGILEYTSIAQQIEVSLIEDEEFWNIINIGDSIVFQSLQRIYIYNVNDHSVNVIDSDSKITKIFQIDQEVFFQILGDGLFRINDGKAIPFMDHQIVKENELINIFGNEKDLLILTKDNGFYNIKDNKLRKSKMVSNEMLSEYTVYDAISLGNKGYAIGTIAHGLIIINEKGQLKSRTNLNQGLINNTVLTLFEDVTDNIWLGLDNGISYIDTNSTYELHNENYGILGSVYASKTHNDNLYLGTNQGLFYRKVGSKGEFSFIEGTDGQVWCLKVINDTLLCGHDSGTFIVDEGQVEKISNITGTWSIARIDHKSDLLLQGNYDGLYVLEKSNGAWKLRNKLKGFNSSSRYFETLGNEIFVNHEYKGIFKLKVDSSYAKIKSVSIDSTLKGTDSGIAKYNGDLLYAYKKGVFKYDESSQNFIKDSFLSKVYTEDEYESGKLIVDEKENLLWVFTKSNITYITLTGLTDEQRIKNIPLKSKVRKGIIGYENISGLADDKYLIGTTSGYITVDIKQPKPKDFSVHIGQVINGFNEPVKKPHSINVRGEFNNIQNNLELFFYSPEYNKHVSTQYRYQLIGIYDDWSNWSENSSVSFENLPHGDYTFNVVSKIGDAISSNSATYAFEIAKPWYISNVMLLLYAFGVFIFLFLMHSIYKQYYKKQRQELIDKNEKELRLTQVQSEREIIKIKNDKLKVDFSSKSKELAASLLSISKKNDLLRRVKDELSYAKDENSVRTIIKTISKSLRGNDDWDFFQEAFNNADSEFLKKLKQLHPTLTPSDMKLCGYLRLNLSSKEMANLLNITPRSVEIKRYRLRKKLELKHEDNLVNYILAL